MTLFTHHAGTCTPLPVQSSNNTRRHPVDAARCYTAMTTTAGPYTQRGSSDALAIAALLCALAILLAGIVTPVGLLIWEAASPSAVIAEGSAGTFNAAASSPGGFVVPTLTSVQTSIGSVTVVGTFSALRGSHLVVEEHNKSAALQLCVADAPHVCAPLAGLWAGPMQSTPAAAHTTAFARRGLSTDNLGRWLGFGVLGTLIALLVVGLAGAADLDNRPPKLKAP